MLRIRFTLVLSMMDLSLGSASFLMISSTAGIVLGPISSLLRLMVDIPPGMLCERDQVLCADPSILRVDLVFSLLTCVNWVHCLEN